MLRTLACLLYEIKATIPEMLIPGFIFPPGVGPVTGRRHHKDIVSRFGPFPLSTTLQPAYFQ
jgi:hypothetical protein